MEELRNQIGFVTQDTQLFAGTLKENYCLWHPMQAMKNKSCLAQSQL
jgi:ABC-type bacteriocin/lantibiotic exporter with double-glycine peptidase domain